jgi:4'-phosphopantetheinyl transferase EntD
MQWTELFPEQVVVVSATEAMWKTPVLPEEEALISQAMEKRQREFRAGRHCAHAALAEFGLTQKPILRDDRRAPIWPTGYLGSISHCQDFCFAACCALGDIRGLGVDVEPLAPLRAGLDNYIHSKRESRFLQMHPELPERLIFSAKESLYKCLYPFVKRYFGFHTVELVIDPENRHFQFVQSGESPLEWPSDLVFHGRYLTHQNHLFTACYLVQP